MPRTESPFDQIQSDGRRFAAVLQAEIAEREAELEALRDHAGRWLAALNGGAPAKRGPGRPKGSGTAKKARAPKPKRSSPPVDWGAVLAKLPKAFTTADFEKATPALKDHRQARNVALARWSRLGAVRKMGAGKYRKVGRGA